MKNKWWIIGLAVALYIGVRLWGLTASCLWFDEIFSVHAAQHPWNELFSFVAQDLIHPPLFYVLLKIWIAIGGESLLSLRLFPVAVVSLAVVPIIYLCREIKLTAYEIAGVVLLLAVNGSLIKYAQEVRMYSLLFCLTAFSVWLFVRFIKRENETILWILIANLLLIYTHYFGWLVVGSELIAVVWLSSKRNKFLAITPVWIASFLPWAYAVWVAHLQNAGLDQNLNWAVRPGLRHLFQFIAVMHQPFYFQQSSSEPAFSLFAIPFILIFTATITFLFLFFKDDRREVRALMLLALLPLAIAFLVSLVSPFSIWGTRHLIVIFAPYFVLAVMGFRYMQPKAAQYAGYALVLVMLLSASVFNFTRGQAVFSWCGWEVLAAQAKDSQTTKVYAFEDFIAYELWFSLEREAEGKFHVVLIEDDPDIPEDKAYFIPRGFDGIEKANENSISGDRLWIAVRGIAGNPEHPLWLRLREKGYKIGTPIIFDAQDEDAFLVPIEKE